MRRIILLFTVLCFCVTTTRAQWVNQNAGFTNRVLGFYEISIVDANVVWAICYDGIGGLFGPAHVLDFTRTTNGGTTWTPGKMGTDSSLAFSNICALSATEAWVCMHKFNLSTGGGVFHTTDGGMTWTQSGAGTIFDSSSFPNFVYFKNPMNGVAGGDANNGYFEIYTTTDGGATWTRTPQTNIPAFVAGGSAGWFDGFCVLGDTLWFGTNKGQMYKSTDFGQTWTVSTVTPLGYTVYEIAFLDDGQTGLANLRSGSATMLFATSDGGATWVQRPTHPKWKQSKLTAVPGTNRFVSTSVISSNRGSAYSDDHGVTWVQIDANTPKAACRFLNSSTGWAGGYFSDNPQYGISGGIYKWDTTILGISHIEPGKVPSLYPNPATDKISISFADNRSSHSLSFYNSVGRLVKEVDAASSEEIDIADLPAGLYYIRSKHDAGVSLKFIRQ
jgi:photosystem II stability/assembly factor-like uncharacterized protein